MINFLCTIISYKIEITCDKIGKNCIKLFDYTFIDNNKDKCKILYGNQEYNLKEEFDINDNTNEKFQIKLKHSDDNIPIRSKTRNSVLSKEDNFILENISNIDYLKYEDIENTDPMDYIRDSVNNFNQKTYLFPNLNFDKLFFLSKII